MKFPELVIHNFLAITDAKINLADRGLVAIMGENQADTSADSNGAGKSTIPDALCWCWYGTTARGVTGDAVINRDAKKDCFVESSVTDGAITYTATRYRKHKVHKNGFRILMNDGLVETDLTKGTDKLTQELALQILGCSLEVFAGSIYAGQEQMPDLPAMTDKNLKLLIEEAAGTTVLEGAYRKARECHAAAVAARDGLAAQADTIQRQITFIDGQIVSAKVQQRDWEDKKVARLNDVRGEIGRIVPQLKKLQVDMSLYDITTLEAEVADCDVRIGLVSTEQTELRDLDHKVTAADAEYRSLHNGYNRAVTILASAERIRDDVRHKIGCPCAECGRPLTTSELGAATDAAEKRVEVEKDSVQKHQTAMLAAQEALNSAQKARDAFAVSMTDVSAVSRQRASLLDSVNAYRALERLQVQTTTTARSLRDRMTSITAETNPYAGQIESLETQRKALDVSLADVRSKIEIEDANVAIEAEVVKLYSPAGVRAQILDEVTPFLNAQTAKYLSILTDGNMEATWNTLTPTAKGELRENFTIEVTNSTGGDSFKGLSGGEKRKARIACALALQDLVATRASKPIEIFIGDEIDDALDPAGLERLMIILEDKAGERGSVFIISHNSLRDFIPQVITVEKLSNKTTKITETTL